MVLYTKKSVRAIDNPQESDDEAEGEIISSPSKKRRKRRTKRKKKKSSKARHDFSEAACQSCDSIESSPSRYKDDLTWTGYKIKKRISHRDDQEDTEDLDPP